MHVCIGNNTVIIYGIHYCLQFQASAVGVLECTPRGEEGHYCSVIQI